MDYLLWIKALHVIAVIAWMAGLLYLPRLYVYHCQVESGSAQCQLFQTMELKLLRVIMNPAMIVAWLCGLVLAIGQELYHDIWFLVKLIAVILMTSFHMMLARWRKEFAAGQNQREERFYRLVNEIPTVLMIIIVIMVIVKPFL